MVIAVIMIVWMGLGVGGLGWIGYGPLPAGAPSLLPAAVGEGHS